MTIGQSGYSIGRMTVFLVLKANMKTTDWPGVTRSGHIAFSFWRLFTSGGREEDRGDG